MKFPALWTVASFAAGIAIATRWPGPPKLWLAALRRGAPAVLTDGQKFPVHF